MSRPKRVYPSTLHKYNKLHTRKAKMYCGTELTELHLVKETNQYYISIESWAFCASKYKQLKYGTELKLDIPVIKNEKTIDFLNTHAWHDWVGKERKDKETDMIETLEFLNRVFPEKKKVYFYELKSIVSAFCHGSFIRYDKDGKIEKPSKHCIEQRKYYINKYNGFLTKSDIKLPNDIEELKKAYRDVINDDEKSQKAYDKYRDASDNYLYKHHNLTDTFINIGENIIVTPYIFSKCCVEGSSYENAGEIYMVVTDDAVYFEAERHF